MEILILLGVFAAAAGSFAKGKNRNIWFWGGLGMIIGPFAVLLLVFLKPGPGKFQGYN